MTKNSISCDAQFLASFKLEKEKSELPKIVRVRRKFPIGLLISVLKLKTALN